jgi:hypothetical protein
MIGSHTSPLLAVVRSTFFLAKASNVSADAPSDSLCVTFNTGGGPVPGALLQENGDFLLLEDGGYILL